MFFGGAVGVTPHRESSSMKAMLSPVENNANSQHVKATAAAIAFVALLMTANPAPLHEASHRPQPTTFPTLLVNNIEPLFPLLQRYPSWRLLPHPALVSVDWASVHSVLAPLELLVEVL